MSLFDLVGSLLEPLFDLVPRLTRRPASNEWMVIDSLLKGPRESLRPALHVPAFTPVDYLPKHQVPIDCGLQRVTTADGVNVAVNATARVEIVDPIVCRQLTSTDWEEAAAMIIRSQVCETATGHNWSHLQDLWLDGEGMEEIGYDLQEIGMSLVVFRVEDAQEVIPLSLMQ